MLDAAVTFLAQEINSYLKRRTASDLVKAVPGSIADDTGKWAVAPGTIGVALVNVEEDRIMRSQLPEAVIINNRQVLLQPDLKLNLHLVFAARHGTYEHALRYLSYVLMFFQAHPTFTPDEYPGLDPSIARLNLELLSYGPDQLNQLWAYLGTKYLPSAIYRVRMVVLRDTEPMGIGDPITRIDATVHEK
jgi:hypothetical protein